MTNTESGMGRKQVAVREMTAAEALVRILEQKGVDKVFGIPGAGILPVFDAIAQGSSIKTYVVRHEQTSVFAADGYSRATGKVGVCAVTSGPGATNLVSGLYGAWFDRVPLIALTGQVATAAIGTMAFQEAPTPAIVRPVTKAVFQPRKAADVPRMVYEAFRVATTAPMGPVLIDLPLDVQKGKVTTDLVDHTVAAPVPQANRVQVEQAWELIRAAERPVIIAGGGVILAEASAELKELAELLSIPVVNPYMGKGSFPADHPLWAGMMGTMCNTPLGNKTVLEADLLINLGGRFADRSVGNVKVMLGANGKPPAKVIHVNLDPAELGKSVPTTLGIAAEVRGFMRDLIALVRESGEAEAYRARQAERVEKLQKDRVALARQTRFGTEPIKPQEAIAELRRFLARDAIVTHDCGLSQIWSGQLFDAYEPRTYLVTGGAGTMGWGLGAAFGAKLALPERQVVNLLGDGSLGMSLQDLATLAHHNVPVVIYLLNNTWLGLIRQQQSWYYGGRYISTRLLYEAADKPVGIDFVGVAKAMGLGAERVERLADLRPAIERAFAAGKPYLLEVTVDPDAVCPMADDGTLTGVRETV